MAKRSIPPATAESYTRRRGVVIGAAFAAMLLAGVGGWFAINAMSRETAQTNWLPIRSIAFAGELSRVDQDDLKRIAGGIQVMGGSMLRTDLNQVKAAVRQVEWVRDAEVRRRFPGTLEIRIEEHKPFAAGRSPLGSETSPLKLAELRLSARRAWQLKLDNGSTLELGRNDGAQRLARFSRAYSQVPMLQAASARIDLRYQTGLAVRAIHATAADSRTARKTGTRK
jgi:cell division protein FtsQ